jgi:hypothetical protein
MRMINQSVIVQTPKTKSLPPFAKGRNSPLWKRGERGDFRKSLISLCSMLGNNSVKKERGREKRSFAL